jgi:hypothetical protein
MDDQKHVVGNVGHIAARDAEALEGPANVRKLRLEKSAEYSFRRP